MRRLASLSPRWIVGQRGAAVGVLFDCPTCGDLEGHVKIAILFENPADGGAPEPRGTRVPGDNDGRRWHREGTTFADLTLSPSVDCSQCGRSCTVAHWHGVINHGDAVGGGA